MKDWQKIAILSCQALLVSWILVFFLVLFGSKLRSWYKDQQSPTVFRMAREAWQRQFSCSYDPSAKDRVTQKVDERRVERMQTVAIAGLIVTLCNSSIILWNLSLDNPRWYKLEMDVVYVFLQLMAIIVNVWPSLMVQWSRSVYSACMAFVILHVTPFVSHVDPFWHEVLFCVRTVMSLAILDLRLILFWNAAYAVASLIQFHFAWGNQCGDVHLSVLAFSLKELMAYSLISGICSSYKEGITAEIVERLGGTASRTECGAVTSVLKAMSDVVVKLDCHLRLMEDSPKLTAFLLRESGGDSVRGAQFERFLFAQEDRQTFYDCIDAATDQDEAEAVVPIHVRLRDGVGSCVTAELFHTAIEDVAGESFHIVGIRELQAESEIQTKGNKEWGTGLPPMQRNAEPASVLPQPKPAPRPNPKSNIFLDIILAETSAHPPRLDQARPATYGRNDGYSDAGSVRSSRSSRSSRSRRSPSPGPRIGSRNALRSGPPPPEDAPGVDKKSCAFVAIAHDL